jgi:Superinfection immunity protein
MIGSLIATLVLGGITGGLIGLYLLPVLLAWVRHVPDLGAIAVINILLGWTLAGWVIALALALRSNVQPNPAIQVIQHLPPYPLPPGADLAGLPAHPARRPAAAPPLILPPPEDLQPSAEADDQ